MLAAPMRPNTQELSAGGQAAGLSGSYESLASLLRACGAVHVVEWDGEGVAPAGPFDTVIDFAFLPRRMDMPDAWAELAGRVAAAGRILHVAPSSNHVDEVYYMPSPTVFQDFYGANGWTVEALRVARERRRGLDVFSYRPGHLDALAHGGLDDARYLVFCAARREAASTLHRVPQQGLYAKAWRAAGADAAPPSHGVGPRHGLAAFVRNNRFLYRMAYWILTPRKRRRLMAECLPVLRRMAW